MPSLRGEVRSVHNIIQKNKSHAHLLSSVPANGDRITEINSACSSDLFPGIDSIKISFMLFPSFTSSAQNINYMNHSSQSLS